jgi:hypothetical protein
MEDVFSLVDSNIYSNKISLPQSVIEEHFKKLIIEYFQFILKDDKKFVISHMDVFKYTIIRGLETMTHVFKIILLYTNNLSAAVFHSQRSICLYVEFMLQIIENSQTFLRLRSRDAVMYVYKETIFRLKKETIHNNIHQNIDTIENEKYKMRENINKILYSVVDYLQKKNDGLDSVTLNDVQNIIKTKATGYYITM